MKMEIKFKHQESNYVVEGSFEKETIQIDLFHGGRKFSKAMIYEEFPEEVKNAYETIWDIFEILEDKKNIVVEPEKGSIMIVVNAINKNRVILIPSEIQLAEVGGKKMGEVFIEEFTKMK